MPKKMKKKVKFKLIPIFILIISVILLYFVFSYLIDTKIKNIYIYNNELLSDQEIIDLAQINEYPSFYKTSSKSIEKNIKSSKIVKSVKIKKKFFNVLYIYIEEYEPLFIKDNLLVLSSKEKIDYLEWQVPVMSNIIENEVYNKFINSYSEIDKFTRGKISQIIYSPSEYDKERFLLYMNDGNNVYINIRKLKNLKFYSDIYPTLDNKKGTLYLDSGNHFEVFK